MSDDDDSLVKLPSIFQFVAELHDDSKANIHEEVPRLSHLPRFLPTKTIELPFDVVGNKL
jgi:hypothetical protein